MQQTQKSGKYSVNIVGFKREKNNHNFVAATDFCVKYVKFYIFLHKYNFLVTSPTPPN